MAMTSRQRVKSAVNHQRPGPAPMASGLARAGVVALLCVATACLCWGQGFVSTEDLPRPASAPASAPASLPADRESYLKAMAGSAVQVTQGSFKLPSGEYTTAVGMVNRRLTLCVFGPSGTLVYKAEEEEGSGGNPYFTTPEAFADIPGVFRYSHGFSGAKSGHGSLVFVGLGDKGPKGCGFLVSKHTASVPVGVGSKPPREVGADVWCDDIDRDGHKAVFYRVFGWRGWGFRWTGQDWERIGLPEVPIRVEVSHKYDAVAGRVHVEIKLTNTAKTAVKLSPDKKKIIQGSSSSGLEPGITVWVDGAARHSKFMPFDGTIEAGKEQEFSADLDLKEKEVRQIAVEGWASWDGRTTTFFRAFPLEAPKKDGGKEPTSAPATGPASAPSAALTVPAAATTAGTYTA